MIFTKSCMLLRKKIYQSLILFSAHAPINHKSFIWAGNNNQPRKSELCAQSWLLFQMHLLSIKFTTATSYNTNCNSL